MKKANLLLITALLCFSCGKKTEADLPQEDTIQPDSVSVTVDESRRIEKMVTGHFNRDQVLDTAFLDLHYLVREESEDDGNCSWVVPTFFCNETDVDQDEDIWGDCEYCTIRFTDPTIPAIRVIGVEGNLHNAGDLDENGTDELIFLPHWFQSSFSIYYLWTLSGDKWIDSVEPLSVHYGCDFIEEELVRPDPTKKGHVIVQFSDFDEEVEFYVMREKSVKMND